MPRLFSLLALSGIAATAADVVQPFRNTIHDGIFHPSVESTRAFLSSTLSPAASEHLTADVAASSSATAMPLADSYTMGEFGRGLIQQTINWAKTFLADKKVERSTDSQTYPYWRFLPKYLNSAIPDGETISWSAPCFASSSASVKSNSDGKSWTLTLTLGKPTSLLCYDSYMFATIEGVKLESFFFQGTHAITWTPAATVRPAELFDVKNRGIRVFRFVEPILTVVADLLDTALLFEPMLTKAPSKDAEARNLDFLLKYAQHFKMVPRNITNVAVDESLIQSGDFFGIIRLDGLDPMLAWAMGSATGHTTIAIRDPADNKLYIHESTTNGNYWPTNGIQRTPYQTWIQQAQAAGYNMLWAPLKPEQRKKFNVTAALDFFKTVEGVDYGYYNMLMAWIDTLDSNYPCLPPDYSMCLDINHVEVLLGLLDHLAPTIGDLLFGQAFNHRLNTAGLRAPELLQTATEQGMTDLRALPVIVEDDKWVYNIKKYNATTQAPSMVCCVFVCHMWKEGGLFDGVDRAVNCGEFTNGDDYMLDILDGAYARPQQCVAADPDNKLCQLAGDFTVTFVDYATRDMTPHMAEKCPSLAPDYIKPLGC